MKEVSCQYTFGVYTNWDKCVEAKKKDDGRADVDDVRRKYQRKYRKMFEAREAQVFFVDVNSVAKIKVSLSL